MYEKPRVERFGTFQELSIKREKEPRGPRHALLDMLPRGAERWDSPQVPRGVREAPSKDDASPGRPS